MSDRNGVSAVLPLAACQLHWGNSPPHSVNWEKTLPDTTRKLWVVTEVTEVDGYHSFETNRSHLFGRKGSITLQWAQRSLTITKLLPSAKKLSSQLPSERVTIFKKFCSKQSPKRPAAKPLWLAVCCQASLGLLTNHPKGPIHTNITSPEKRTCGPQAEIRWGHKGIEHQRTCIDRGLVTWRTKNKKT